MKLDPTPTAFLRWMLMARRRPEIQHFRFARLKSAFWLLMLVSHMPGLVRSVSQLWDSHPGSSLVAAFGFAAACTLFALKILDVRWLRFNTDRKAVFSLALAVALAHANLMRFASDAGEEFPTPLVVSNLLLASNLISSRRLLRQSLDWAGQLLSACRLNFLSHIGVVVTFDPLPWLRFLLRSRSVRAPPLPTQLPV